MEEVVDVHKNDMSELTSGHLNESKLWNPSTQSRESWASANKPALRSCDFLIINFLNAHMLIKCKR